MAKVPLKGTSAVAPLWAGLVASPRGDALAGIL
jgi:hypothetical protein